MATTTTLTGTTGNDTLNAPGTVATDVVGLQGNDTITLVLENDEANAGQGNDSIALNISGEASNIVNAGDGNDTLTMGTAITTFNGNLGFGDGADRAVLTALVNGGTLRGNQGNDTISLAGNVINSFVGTGQGNDTIALIAGNTLTNTTIFGGANADTITVSAAALTLTTIQASDGHDRILATALTGSTVLAAGKGYDSIAMGTAGGTIAGGGLDDTITFAGVAQAGTKIYGDALGTTTEGTGTGGAADGADSISLSAGTVAAGASVYGGGGNDSLAFAADAGASALVVDGGKGADLIGSTAVDFSVTAGSILGGGGFDTIKMISGESGLVINGGDGGDSIYILSAGEGTSIQGGSGNDTITMGVQSASTAAGLVSINGGAGTDLINLGITALSANAGAASATTALGSIATAGYLGEVVYSGTMTGDQVKLNVTAALTTVNFLAGAPAIGYGGTVFSTALVSTFSAAAGSIAVYDTDGLGASSGDLIISVYTTTSVNFINLVGGDELLKTTTLSVGTSFALDASNIDITLAQSSSAITITF